MQFHREKKKKQTDKTATKACLQVYRKTENENT